MGLGTLRKRINQLVIYRAGARNETSAVTEW